MAAEINNIDSIKIKCLGKPLKLSISSWKWPEKVDEHYYPMNQSKQLLPEVVEA